MTVLHHTVELGSPTGGAGTGAREYNATLFVESDDPHDTGHAILNYVIANGFNYGRKWAFGNDTNDKVRLYQIDPPQYISGSAYKWRVPLHYKEVNALASYLTSEDVLDPTRIQPQIRVRNSGRQEVIEEAYYRGGLRTDWVIRDQEPDWFIQNVGGKAPRRLITNSSEQPYVPPVEATRWDKVVRVTRRTFSAVVTEEAFPTFWINDRDFTIYNNFIAIPVKKHEMLFQGWEMDQEQYEGLELVRVEFVGHIRKGGWRKRLLDAGTELPSRNPYPDGRGGTADFDGDPPGVADVRNLLDRQGMPIDKPQLLNGRGELLDVGADERYYGIWSIYDEIDPTALGFFAGITAVPTS